MILERLDALTRTRGFQLIRRLEPAFIIFTVVGVVIATYTLQPDLDARHEERTVRAWQTVSRQAPGISGKSEALQYLAANGHVLNRVDVSPNSVRKDGDRVLLGCNYRVYLANLDLSGTIANRAQMPCTEMDADDGQNPANFESAQLEQASFVRANAEAAIFRTARLTSADFRGAQLGRADFEAAELTGARFEYASLRYVAFHQARLDGASVDHAMLLGVGGLNCDTLKTTDGWDTACRAAELECGAEIPKLDSCGPGAIPESLRLPPTALPASANGQCTNKLDLRREIEFRLDQLDRAVYGDPPITRSGAAPRCNRATSIYVAAKLGGISQRPPPKEDETVWIGGSGYGYRHIPFKTGVRSAEFISDDLRQLGADYLACIEVEDRDLVGRLNAAVSAFDVTGASGDDRVEECSDDWVGNATTAWAQVARSARSLLTYD